MPKVCRCGGISIYLYYNHHPLPPFSCSVAGATMEVTINPVGILRGSLPAAQITQVLAWAQKRQRQADLAVDWQLTRAGQPLNQIPLGGLDADGVYSPSDQRRRHPTLRS